MKNFVREISVCEIIEEKPLLKLCVRGNGFLWNMVRIIAGTLLEVGSGKRSPQDVSLLLETLDRTKAGPTLPPHGLILHSVDY